MANSLKIVSTRSGVNLKDLWRKNEGRSQAQISNNYPMNFGNIVSHLDGRVNPRDYQAQMSRGALYCDGSERNSTGIFQCAIYNCEPQENYPPNVSDKVSPVA